MILIKELSFRDFIANKDNRLWFEPLSDFVGFGLKSEYVIPSVEASKDFVNLRDVYELGHYFKYKENIDTCVWLAEFEGVCCNGDCPLCADFVDNETTCKVCKFREDKS